MNARGLILLAAILTPAFALVGGDVQPARAESMAERATEKAEERTEEAKERAEEAKERAEERAEERVEEETEEKAEGQAESAGERAAETGGADRGEQGVKLKLKGGPETRFSGTCSVGADENSIGGEVPETLNYKLNGRELQCEIQNRGAGPLRVVLLGGDEDRSVFRTNARGGTIKLTYSSNGISSSISSDSREDR